MHELLSVRDPRDDSFPDRPVVRRVDVAYSLDGMI